jgi:hypothetical protein
MNNSKLIQLIRESINEYIREIDHAGEEAAVSAKIAKIGEAIESREKKMNMEGIDEAYHDMIDKSKMKELSGEVKALKKSLAKYEKQLEKLKNKGNKTEKVEDTEEKEEIIDEVSIDENSEDSPYSVNPKDRKYLSMPGMENFDEEERFDADGTPNEEGMYDAEGNRISFADIDKAMHRGESDRDNMYLNESFLHMQKLAGVITEAQYKAKRKALNEGVFFLNDSGVNLIMDKSKYMTKPGSDPGVYVIYDLSKPKGKSSFGDDDSTQKVGVWYSKESKRPNQLETDDENMIKIFKDVKYSKS